MCVLVCSAHDNVSSSHEAVSSASSSSPSSSLREPHTLVGKRRTIVGAAEISRGCGSLVARMGEDGEDLADVINAIIPPSDDDYTADDRAANEVHGEDDIGGDMPAESTIPLVDAIAGPDDVPGVGVACPVPRHDTNDTFFLFGDVSETSKSVAIQRYFQIVLFALSITYLLPQIAITALLKLLHGAFGERLGVQSSILAVGGGIPQTAQTLFGHARELTNATMQPLFSRHNFELPPDPNLRGHGRSRTVAAHYSLDLAKSIALKLMDPTLNGPESPFYYQANPALPEGFFCAGTYFSPLECSERDEALKNARFRLADDARSQIPGVALDRIGVIAIGVSWFTDSVSPLNHSSTYALLLGISNLHPDTAQSPNSIVLGGHWELPTIVHATKIDELDVGLNASPATMARSAEIESMIYKKVVADPLQALYTRKSLIVRAADLHGLPADYPHQVKLKLNLCVLNFSGVFIFDAFIYSTLH
jgi:hypothetical protein